MMERYAAVRLNSPAKCNCVINPQILRVQRTIANDKHLTDNTKHHPSQRRLAASVILHEVKGAVSAAHADT
jgi:hypothetical protein